MPEWCVSITYRDGRYLIETADPYILDLSTASFADVVNVLRAARN
jgi:hypothetical protein